MTRTRPPAQTILALLTDEELTHEQAWKQTQMLLLAKELGYAFQPLVGIRRDFAQNLFSRMTNRLGKSIFQTITFSMSMPRHAAEQIFVAQLLTLTSHKNLEWRANSMSDMSLLFGDLLDSLSFAAAGLTRACPPPSESQARVFSVLMPIVEISHSVLPFGAHRLYLNCQYVLFDNAATLHPPKDMQRREILISEELQTLLRQQVLQDVLALSQKNLSLSAAWWRQLGQEDTAQAVEAGHITARQRQRIAAASAATAALPAPTREPIFELDCILREVPTEGAARCWYLVRWAGYEPSWERWRIMGEVGSPLETWEALKNVRNTIAYADWQRAKQAPSLEEEA